MPEDQKKPKVSLIMAAYNAEKYLGEAIESILRQSYANWELIIIDDASTDSTAEIAFSYHDNRILLIRNDTNRGSSYCRNTGIENASGEFIAIMDSDDVALPERLMKQLQYFGEHAGIAILGSGVIFFDTKREWHYTPPSNPEFISCFLAFRNCFIHSGMMFRKSFFMNSGLKYDESYKVGEDYKLYSEASMAGYKLAGLRKPLVRYRQWEQQVMQNQTADFNISFPLFQGRMKKLFGLDIPPGWRKSIYAFMIGRTDVTPAIFKEIKSFLDEVRKINLGRKSYDPKYFSAVLYFFYLRLGKYFYLEKGRPLAFALYALRLFGKLGASSFLIFMKNKPEL